MSSITPPDRNKVWTEDEIDKMWSKWKDGYGIHELALYLGRTERSVATKLHVVRHGYRSNNGMYKGKQ